MYKNKNQFMFDKNELKIFTKIYASNWCSVPNQFKEKDYQGKNIEQKIQQFICDIKQLEMQKETLNELLLQFYHQGDANDTEHFIDTIYELFKYQNNKNNNYA